MQAFEGKSGIEMYTVTKETIEEILQPIVRAGGAVVAGVQVGAAGDVIAVIEVDPARAGALEDMRQEAERAITGVRGVTKVSVILTAEKQQKSAAPDPHGMNKNPVLDVPARHIIAVASGKGGVGKSTVAANLAVALGRGFKVGLLDADIYGPSQPLMMGNEDYKPAVNAQKKLIPLLRHGIKIMSIGFMTDRSKALVWRGPMVQTAVYQMLRDVAWADEDGEPLDYLIIDMPPGTGDVQLTLAQKVRMSGAVIVSTPQDIALIDARRAVEMFRKTGVPVLGIIENMSVHICSNCGHVDPIFGQGGAREEAEKLGVPFLGEIPLARDIRVQSDSGVPIILAQSESAYAKVFAEIADHITRP